MPDNRNKIRRLVANVNRGCLWRLRNNQSFILVLVWDIELQELEQLSQRDPERFSSLFSNFSLTFFDFPTEVPLALGDSYEYMAGTSGLYVRPPFEKYRQLRECEPEVEEA